MAHVLEPATSGRAKCRGCQTAIAKDELRFGERVPNPFADGDTTLWFHLKCAAFKRPEPLLATLDAHDGDVTERELLTHEARLGLEHRRLPRVDGAERARSGRAKCRCCREPIAKDAWRVKLVYYEEGRFEPSGFIHAGCAEEYCGTAEVMARVRHFGVGLLDADLDAFERALRATG